MLERGQVGKIKKGQALQIQCAITSFKCIKSTFTTQPLKKLTLPTIKINILFGKTWNMTPWKTATERKLGAKCKQGHFQRVLYCLKKRSTAINNSAIHSVSYASFTLGHPFTETTKK